MRKSGTQGVNFGNGNNLTLSGNSALGTRAGAMDVHDGRGVKRGGDSRAERPAVEKFFIRTLKVEIDI